MVDLVICSNDNDYLNPNPDSRPRTLSERAMDASTLVAPQDPGIARYTEEGEREFERHSPAERVVAVLDSGAHEQILMCIHLLTRATGQTASRVEQSAFVRRSVVAREVVVMKVLGKRAI